MIDLPRTWTTAHEELKNELLPRLQQAWESDGVGSYHVGDAYVQWAKYAPGLQIECESHTFLDESNQLGFIERRKLARLGFERPQPPDWPNYYRRFESRDELDTAAAVLSSVVLDVLSPVAEREPSPEPGRVLAVVPVAKVDLDLVWEVVRRCAEVLQPTRDVIVLNLLPGEEPRREDIDAPFLSEAYALDATTQTTWLARVAALLALARLEGCDVVVAAPQYIPMDTDVYDETLAQQADAVIAVGTGSDFRLFTIFEPAPFAPWANRAFFITYDSALDFSELERAEGLDLLPARPRVHLFDDRNNSWRGQPGLTAWLRDVLSAEGQEPEAEMLHPRLASSRVAGAFAEGMLPKVRLLRDPQLPPHQRTALLGSLNQDLRKLCDACMEELQPTVSRRALTVAEGMGVNLWDASWHHQPSFDPGRTIFHLEHVVPIGSVRAACLEASTVAEILAALEGLEMAWILKEENEVLTRLGFRSRRPDPAGAYAEAGIELVRRPLSSSS